MLAAAEPRRDEELRGNRAPLMRFQKPKLRNREETFQFVDEAALKSTAGSTETGGFSVAQIYICQLITSMKRRIKTKSKYLPK